MRVRNLYGKEKRLSYVLDDSDEQLANNSGLNYELIYQLDAIEYLFVYFQLGHVSGLHAHLQEQWML